MGKYKHTYNSVTEYVNQLGYELIDKNYKNNMTKLTLKDCNGYYLYIKFANLLLGNKPDRFHKSNPYTIQNIKLWCKLNNKEFELLSDMYEGSNKILKWRCLKEGCKEEFKMRWDNIYSGDQNCPVCVGRQVGLSNCLATKNPELAKEWHPTKNGNLTPYDVTCGSHKKVWWKCSKNPKHEWKASIYIRNTGINCPYCFGRYPTKNYNLLVCEPELIEEWNYEKNKKRPEEFTPKSGKKVWWKCKECGHEWKCAIGSRNRKDGKNTGCPQCSESKGEKNIKEILKKKNIYYNSQYSFDDLIGIKGGLLRFDISVFLDKEKTKLKMLIEYDGKQHYEWIKGMMTKKEFEILQYHDKLKNEYCHKNNIKLLRIPYWDYDKIREIFENIK